MTDVKVSVAPDRDIFVPEGDDPEATAATLLSAAAASGLPARSVRVAVQPGGFLVPAQVVSDNAPAANEAAVTWSEIAPLVILFDSTITPPLHEPDATYGWDWGDGTTSASAGADPGHTYAAPGEYTVAMSVEDSSTGATASWSGPITVTGY